MPARDRVASLALASAPPPPPLPLVEALLAAALVEVAAAAPQAMATLEALASMPPWIRGPTAERSSLAMMALAGSFRVRAGRLA